MTLRQVFLITGTTTLVAVLGMAAVAQDAKPAPAAYADSRRVDTANAYPNVGALDRC
jgi:hypothetical protein